MGKPTPPRNEPFAAQGVGSSGVTKTAASAARRGCRIFPHRLPKKSFPPAPVG